MPLVDLTHLSENDYLRIEEICQDYIILHQDDDQFEQELIATGLLTPTEIDGLVKELR